MILFEPSTAHSQGKNGLLRHLDTISVPDPFGVAVSPGGSRVYVTNPTAGILSVIDTAGHTVVATVALGVEPTGVAVTPDAGRVYVANTQDGTVSVIDAATLAVTGTVDVGVPTGGVAVSPDGARVYVTTLSGATLSVIDTATDTVIADVPMGAGAFPTGSWSTSRRSTPGDWCSWCRDVPCGSCAHQPDDSSDLSSSGLTAAGEVRGSPGRRRTAGSRSRPRARRCGSSAADDPTPG